MPVIRDASELPDWMKWSNFGVGVLQTADDLERHFHDAHEYWLVFEGRARVMSEGEEYEVGPGDVLCTKMGDEHDVIEVIEAPFKSFFIEDELHGRKRPGHLHHPEDS